MGTIKPYILLAILFAALWACDSSVNNELKEKLVSTEGLVALWDFKEKAGEIRNAEGMGVFPLKEAKAPVQRVKEGPFGFSARFDSGQYLTLPWEQTGLLNIYGEGQALTMIAWVKWSGKVSCFIGGMWNEHQDGGKRQYGLFVDLPHYNGGQQVCGHIALTGKPTPPFPYSIDYSASPQKVAVDQWVCVAFTYDGEYAKSFYNGEYMSREPELINHTTGFEGYPEGLTQSKNPYHFPGGLGNNGSDFTVGAVLVKGGMGNYYKGLLGGLAVFNRALCPDEIQSINSLSKME